MCLRLPGRMIGQKVAHFEILERMASGGMGVVYKARDSKLDRLVALKLLPPHLAGDPAAREQLTREAKAASALDHPNICTIYGFDRDDEGQLFMAMACYAGETLEARLERGALPVDEALHIARGVADGLAAAHTAGVVHRDVKPANIALTEDGVPKILDFGLAAVSSATATVESDAPAGTVAYMSPEQARGEPAGPETDLWSLGVVLYEMLAGRLPFRAEHPQAVIHALLNQDPAPIEGDTGPIPEALTAVVGRCLARDPSDRYGSAAELAATLDALSGSGSRSPSRPVAVPSAATPRPAAGTGSRIWVAVVLTLILAAAAAGGWLSWRLLREPQRVVAPESTSVAVMPFSYRGDEQYRYLGEGIVDLLSARLDGAGEIRAIDPRAVVGTVARGDEEILDPRRAAEISDGLGASHFVLGGIVEIGGRLQLEASLYQRGGETAEVQAATTGDVVNAFDEVDEIAIRLLAALGAEAAPGERAPATVTTTSLDAFKAYLDGQSAFQSGDFQASVDAYERAVELDPEFALAWYRLSIAYEWQGTTQDLHHYAAEQAHRHSERLTDRERRLLAALRVWRQGRNREARQMYSEIVQVYPDEIDAWYELGEVLFHRNALYGEAFTAAREPFEHVLSFEADHFASMVHVARIDAFEGRLEAMSERIDRFLEHGDRSSSRSLELRSLKAFTEADAATQRALLEEMKVADGPQLATVFVELSLYARNFEAAERVAEMMTEPWRPARVRAYGGIALAHLQLMRGRWRAAKEQLAVVAGLDPWSALEYRALLSSLSFVPVPRAELRALRAELEALDPATVPTVDEPLVFVDVHHELHPLLRTYLLGQLSARLGDLEAARRFAAEIEGQPHPAAQRGLAADLRRSVEAQVARAENRPAEAVSLLDETLSETKNPLESPVVAEAYERYLKAQLLYESGRYEEALGLYRHIAESSVFEFVYLPVSELWIGEIHNRLGATAEARSSYTRFIELWRGCDAELQPMVELARRRLEELERSAATG